MRKILAKPDIGPFVSNAKQQFRASLHEAHVLADVLLAAQEARDKGIELGPGIDCSGLEKCCLQAARNVMSALRVCKMR